MNLENAEKHRLIAKGLACLIELNRDAATRAEYRKDEALAESYGMEAVQAQVLLDEVNHKTETSKAQLTPDFRMGETLRTGVIALESIGHGYQPASGKLFPMYATLMSDPVMDTPSAWDYYDRDNGIPIAEAEFLHDDATPISAEDMEIIKSYCFYIPSK